MKMKGISRINIGKWKEKCGKKQENTDFLKVSGGSHGEPPRPTTISIF